MNGTKNNDEIVIFLQKNKNGIANELAKLSEQELTSFFNSEAMESLISHFKTMNEFNAFDDFFDFYSMYYRFYAEPGSWTHNHNNWRKYFSQAKKEL